MDTPLVGKKPENLKDNYEKPMILVVDDEGSVLRALTEMLKLEFSVLTAHNARKALALLEEIKNNNGQTIDLVLSDIWMEQMDGIQLLAKVKELNPYVEVIMITGHPNRETSLSALRLGASDYIAKPFKIPEVLSSVRKAIGKRKKSLMDEKIVQELKQSVQHNYAATTEALILAIDAKDNYTKEHCARVARLMMRFALVLGVEHENHEILKKIGGLHDIGKIGVKEQVLNKPEPLTAEEWIQMKQHPLIGYQILQPVDFLAEVRETLLYHHERFDGKGYLSGLKGTQIPFTARMLAIVDVYDALVTDRPYRKALTKQEALAELEKNSGTQFDADMVKIFVEMIREREG